MSERVKCECGWIGLRTELVKNGCLTYGDTWWECPECRKDGSHIKALPKEETPDELSIYAWRKIEDYEECVGFKVSDSFRDGWRMARTTNKMFGLTEDKGASDGQ